jgi:hypothetical protein
MKQTYRDLCDRYGWMVTTVDIDSTLFASILFSFDLVVCSIPRPLICMNHEHVFRDAPIMIVPVGHVAGDNVIVYNGDPTVSWCRTSMIQGLGYTEYPAGKYDGSYGRSIFYRKPRDHNCICWRNQDNLVMVGRQGVWDKRVLVHHSYDVTIMWLDKVREKLNHAV